MEPAGLASTEIMETGFLVTITFGGSEATFLVMHPLLCLESRIYNTAKLDGYQTIHALNQLRAAIICAREYVLDTLEAGDGRIANRANERIYRNATWETGLSVFTKHGIDVFAAVFDQHPLLPPRFIAERYPRMKATLAWKRAHCQKVAVEAQRRMAALGDKSGAV